MLAEPRTFSKNPRQNLAEDWFFFARTYSIHQHDNASATIIRIVNCPCKRILIGNHQSSSEILLGMLRYSGVERPRARYPHWRHMTIDQYLAHVETNIVFSFRAYLHAKSNIFFRKDLNAICILSSVACNTVNKFHIQIILIVAMRVSWE